VQAVNNRPVAFSLLLPLEAPFFPFQVFLFFSIGRNEETHLSDLLSPLKLLSIYSYSLADPPTSLGFNPLFFFQGLAREDDSLTTSNFETLKETFFPIPLSFFFQQALVPSMSLSRVSLLRTPKMTVPAVRIFPYLTSYLFLFPRGFKTKFRENNDPTRNLPFHLPLPSLVSSAPSQ